MESKIVYNYVKQLDFINTIYKWYQDIAYPLYCQKDIIITNRLLYVIFKSLFLDKFDQQEYDNVRNFIIDFLKFYHIDFKMVKYKILLREYWYLRSDIYISNREFITLSIDDFKKFIKSWEIIKYQSVKEFNEHFDMIEYLIKS